MPKKLWETDRSLRRLVSLPGVTLSQRETKWGTFVTARIRIAPFPSLTINERDFSLPNRTEKQRREMFVQAVSDAVSKSMQKAPEERRRLRHERALGMSVNVASPVIAVKHTFDFIIGYSEANGKPTYDKNSLYVRSFSKPKSYGTLSRQYGAYSNYIHKALGDRFIEDTSVATLRDAFVGFTGTKNVQNTAVAVISQCYKAAMNEDYVSENKMKKVVLPEPETPITRTTSLPERRRMTKEVFDELVDFCRNPTFFPNDTKAMIAERKHNCRVYADLITLIRYTGFRPAEASSLMLSDLELSRKDEKIVDATIHITHSMGIHNNGYWGLSKTKTAKAVRSEHVVAKAAYAAIQDAIDAKSECRITKRYDIPFYGFDDQPMDKKTLLFTSYYGNAFTERERKSMANFIKRKTHIDYSLYTLRHEFASQVTFAGENSASIKTMEDVLGKHVVPVAPQPSKAEKDNALASIDNPVSNPVSPETAMALMGHVQYKTTVGYVESDSTQLQDKLLAQIDKGAHHE